MTENEKIKYVKNHYMKLAKSDEERMTIENAANQSYDDFINTLQTEEIIRCPADKPILCMDGSCAAIGEPCPS